MQQGLLVREVTPEGRVAHLEIPAEFAQGQVLAPLGFEGLECEVNDRVSQVSVMIRTFLGLHCISFPLKLNPGLIFEHLCIH